ncbi:carbohydrate ABC transporter permease [Mesorhizobium sp. M1339]|uniref:carbohydrate ABC transporter permease n=1 Tax=Mesorhizobium sp. M1339 TaxID=2957086 RepID=UPI003337A07D
MPVEPRQRNSLRIAWDNCVALRGKQVSRPRSRRRYSITASVATGIVVLVWLYPFWLSLQTSFKSDADIRESPFSPALPPTFGAYVRVWTTLDMPNLLGNSLVLAAGGALINVAVIFPIAFFIARRRIPFSDALFVFFLVGLMVPPQMVILPLYRIAESFGLAGSLPGLVVIHGVYGIPFTLLILRGFFAGIPRSLDESARLDGCSDTGVLLRIIVPLSGPALATVLVLQFINIWNEFLFAVVLLNNSSNWPVTVGVLPVQLSQYFVSWNLPAAALLIAQLPTLVVYVVAQRFVVRGLTAGAVGG